VTDSPALPSDAQRCPLGVVLVDDVADLRLLLRSSFTAHSIDVVGEAANGQEAIEVVTATQPDLVVLDLSMPVLDGLSALPRLIEAAPDARIVVLTAVPREGDPGAMAAGAVAYVEKSVHSAHQLVPELLAGAGLLDRAMRAVDGLHVARAEFGSGTTSPAQARRFARGVLSDETEELVETVELLLTEMVTNAVVHAGSSTTVSVGLLEDHVHVQVHDRVPAAVQARRPDEDAESGRGLLLVEALARSWGSAPFADGKIVWFDVARTSRGLAG
jgi:CheY-like chemotaxis protein